MRGVEIKYEYGDNMVMMRRKFVDGLQSPLVIECDQGYLPLDESRFNLFVRNPNIIRFRIANTGNVDQYEIKIRDRVLVLPNTANITPASWYTEIQSKGVADGLNILREQKSPGEIKALDIGTGSMVLPITLAQDGIRHVVAVDIASGFTEYYQALAALYGQYPWWLTITAIEGDYTSIEDFPDEYFDLVFSNINTEPWPLIDGEDHLVYSEIPSEQRFHDGGYYGTELLEKSFALSSRKLQHGGILVVQHPVYAFDRKRGRDASEATAAILEEANCDVVLYREVDQPILDGSAVLSRLRLYSDRLNWKPKILEGFEYTQVCLFVAKKR